MLKNKGVNTIAISACLFVCVCVYVFEYTYTDTLNIIFFLLFRIVLIADIYID